MRNHLPVGVIGQQQLWISIHCATFPGSLSLCFTRKMSYRSARAPGLPSFPGEVEMTCTMCFHHNGEPYAVGLFSADARTRMLLEHKEWQ